MTLSTDYFEIPANGKVEKYWRVLPLIGRPVMQKGSNLLSFFYDSQQYYLDAKFVTDKDVCVEKADLAFDFNKNHFVILPYNYFHSLAGYKVMSIYKSNKFNCLKSKFAFILNNNAVNKMLLPFYKELRDVIFKDSFKFLDENVWYSFKYNQINVMPKIGDAVRMEIFWDDNGKKNDDIMYFYVQEIEEDFIVLSFDELGLSFRFYTQPNDFGELYWTPC